MSYSNEPPYGAAGMPGGYQLPPQNSVMAIIALVAGIVSIPAMCCYGVGVVPGIAGVVLGFLGRKEIRESNGTKTGDGMALAGLITGAVGIALAIVFWVFVIVMVAIGESSDPYNY